jgi:hypothetical protein
LCQVTFSTPLGLRFYRNLLRYLFFNSTGIHWLARRSEHINIDLNIPQNLNIILKKIKKWHFLCWRSKFTTFWWKCSKSDVRFVFYALKTTLGPSLIEIQAIWKNDIFSVGGPNSPPSDDNFEKRTPDSSSRPLKSALPKIWTKSEELLLLCRTQLISKVRVLERCAMRDRFFFCVSFWRTPVYNKFQIYFSVKLKVFLIKTNFLFALCVWIKYLRRGAYEHYLLSICTSSNDSNAYIRKYAFYNSKLQPEK